MSVRMVVECFVLGCIVLGFCATVYDVRKKHSDDKAQMKDCNTVFLFIILFLVVIGIFWWFQAITTILA